MGGLVFDFFMRVFEFLVGAKGFRYLPQAIILFFLTVLSFECFTTVSTEWYVNTFYFHQYLFKVINQKKDSSKLDTF